MKIPNKINLKPVAILVCLSIILLLSSFYVLAQVPGSNLVLSGGIYPSAPTYTIWSEGGNTFSKDVNGEIQFSEANATAVIQDSIDACSNDDSIYFYGSITVTNDLIIRQSRLKLYGQAFIDYTGSGTCITVDGTNGQVLYGEISDLHIKLTQNGAVGIRLFNQTFYWDLHDIWVQAGSQLASSIGIVLEAGEFGVYWNTISNLRISHLGTGIQLIGKSGGENPNANEIDTPIIRQTSLCGINITDGVSTRIIGGRIENTYAGSIGVWINSDYSTIMGLAFELPGAGANAYYITSNADRTEIFGGRMNVIGTHVVDGGTNTNIWHSRYQASGNDEASNTDWIAHGLANIKPQVVVLTVNETDARYIVQLQATNETHFQIYLYDETAGILETVDKTICWIASYKP